MHAVAGQVSQTDCGAGRTPAEEATDVRLSHIVRKSGVSERISSARSRLSSSALLIKMQTSSHPSLVISILPWPFATRRCKSSTMRRNSERV